MENSALTGILRFCYFCGEGHNRINDKDDFECPECLSVFIPPKAIKEMSITLIHAIHNFHQIELTDRKAKHPEKRNKKKEK